MKTIGEIKAEFAVASLEEYPALCESYRADERSGVQKLIEQAEKKLAALEKEIQRTEAMKRYEYQYDHVGYIC